jgi:hypothetical protein
MLLSVEICSFRTQSEYKKLLGFFLNFAFGFYPKYIESKENACFIPEFGIGQEVSD